MDAATLKLAKNYTDMIFGFSSTGSWADVQRLVRMGQHNKFFVVGDQLLANYNGAPVVWDVIGIDHDTPTDPKFTHSLTIQTHNCLLNASFDKQEALYYATAELAEGAYTFREGTVDYTFTLGSAIPAGGQAVLTWAGDPLVPTQIKTYPTKVSNVAIETVAVNAGATGTALAPINNITRTKYGSNNYKESAIRQWLNSSEASFTFAAQTNYDRPSTGSPYSGAGFLHLLDSDLVAVLGAVDKQVARNTVTDEGGQDLFSDKVFLLSRVEVFGGTEGKTTGEQAYPYYSALAANPTSGALAGRIKYLSGSACVWWLRSPHPSTASNPRHVFTAGELYDISANYDFGAAPACCIV